MMLYNVLNPCIIRTYESGILDSNQRPQRPERRALPTALIPEKKSSPKREALARAAGLEPAISGVTGQRDNQLRYAPVSF